MGLIFTISIISGLVISKWLYSWVRNILSDASVKADGDLIKYITGDYLDLTKCKVDWKWTEPIEVGKTVTFFVQFFYSKSSPYPISQHENVSIKILTNFSDTESNSIAFAKEYVKNTQDDGISNQIKVSFSTRKSGLYNIYIEHSNNAIANSPFVKEFKPGPLSPDHTTLIRGGHSGLSIITMTHERNHRIMIDPRDEYMNKCFHVMDFFDLEEKFNLKVTSASSNDHPPYTYTIRTDNHSERLTMDIVVYKVGAYQASLTYEGQLVKNGLFELVVLSSSDYSEMERNVEKKHLNVWFECRLLNEQEVQIEDKATNNNHAGLKHRAKSIGEIFTFPTTHGRSRIKSTTHVAGKAKKVFCYFTSKQIVIREYFLKIFYKRIFSFRLNSSTKLIFGDYNEQLQLPTLIISDGLQSTAVLACEQRDLLAATFTGIIHQRTGRTESFDEKMKYFYSELKSHHKLSRFARDSKKLDIDRNDLLNSSLKATKNFTTSDWTSDLIITFKGENGLDWGGLNKEWIHLLCTAMFGVKPGSETGDGTAGGNGMFRRLKDDPQALVLPAPEKRSGFKLKYYEFAGKIVGKCLIDSAIGGENARHVSATFARSFLAQLIGLPVACIHFETDDPDLFTSKITYILEHDVADLELTFTEEEYNENGNLTDVVELVTGGKNIKVTNDNKLKYLNRMASYKLHEAIKPEMDAFTKGLYSLVPDHMLSVFDENELELVLCGSSNIKVEDMRQHCVTDTHNTMFATTLQWFWVAVSSFSQEELARLLQFTTGCSQLPPDGFASLKPNFKISFTSGYHVGGLPTAHTCFNELCLPLYESYEDLYKMLKTAITEGSTGFQLI